MTRLFWGGLLCAAWLTGCGAPPKLSQPTGFWVDLNPPEVKAGATHAPKTPPARVPALEEKDLGGSHAPGR